MISPFKCEDELSIIDLMEAVNEEESDDYIRQEIAYYAGSKIEEASLIKKLNDTANFKKSFLDEETFCEYIEGGSKFLKAITTVRKSRDPKVKHFVGKPMIQKAKRVKCVVTGWTVGKTKVWYDVLDNDGKHKFIVQDSLVQMKPDETAEVIQDDEVGRYFTGFDGAHYIPNEILASIYPEDAAVRKTAREQMEKKARQPKKGNKSMDQPSTSKNLE